MIDGSEKRKCQLVFEIQSSRVYEKRSNKQTGGFSSSVLKSTLYKSPAANLYFPHVYSI